MVTGMSPAAPATPVMQRQAAIPQRRREPRASATGHTTYHTYPLSVTNALSQSASTTYDYALGVPLSITDANGNVTSAEYDDFGRMTKVIAPGDSSASPTLQIFYVNYAASPLVPYHVNLLQKVETSSSIRISHFYDGLGREIQTQSVGAMVNGVQKNTIVDVDYDDAGNMVKQTVPYTINYNSTPTFGAQTFTQADTENVYDAFGRLTSSTAPNGNETEYSYGGFSVTMTDARDNATTTEMDVWGRTVLVDEVTGPDVAYDYDVMGRLVEATRNNLVTEISYDHLGRKTALDDPDMGEWSYTYNGVSSLLTQTDARNCVTTLGYDDLNRLTGKTYSGASCGTTPAVTYSYDSTTDGNEGVGRRTGMSDGSGSTVWKYDTRGRLIKEDKTIGTETFTTEYTYNSGDLPTSMTYPDGSSEVLNYDYDEAANLDNIENDDTTPYTYLESLHYDEAGRVTALEMGNSGTTAILSQDFSYHAWTDTTDGGLLASNTVEVNSTSMILLDLNYNSYDANANILEIEEEVDDEVSTFTYDALNRITGMTVVDAGLNTLHSESFTYNASSGSLVSKSMNSVTNTLTYGSTSHPHAVTAYDGNTYN